MDNSSWQASTTFSNLSTGEYTLIAKDEQDCIATTIVAVGTTATNDINETVLTFTLYPNPTDGLCTVELNTITNAKDWVLRIEDIQGKLVRQQVISFSSTTMLLDVSAFAKGIYQVSLSNGREVGFKRFVRM